MRFLSLLLACFDCFVGVVNELYLGQETSLKYVDWNPRVRKVGEFQRWFVLHEQEIGETYR